MNLIDLSTWTHAEFVRIHSHIDGNGRAKRLLTNYQLMLQRFLPVSVDKEARIDYYKALGQYAVNGNLAPFTCFVADLEKSLINTLY